MLHPSAVLAAAAATALLSAAPAPPAGQCTLAAEGHRGGHVARRADVRRPLWSDAADEPAARAAGVWWREALRQTTRFELTEVERDRDLLLLQIDAAAGTLAAVWRTPAGVDRVLGGGRFERSDQLPEAIDQLAWSCRLALGEAATRPVPVALGTSQQARVVLAATDAQQLLQLGGVEAAHSALRTARSRDGGSPFVLDGLGELPAAAGRTGGRRTHRDRSAELRRATAADHAATACCARCC